MYCTLFYIMLEGNKYIRDIFIVNKEIEIQICKAELR